VAATLTREQNAPEIVVQPAAIGRYDENHSEPGRQCASNADERVGVLSNPVESG
jgi:hypothetical protein